MGETVRVQSRAARGLGLTTVAVALVLAAAVLVDSPTRGLSYVPVLALFGFWGWASFCRPYVEVTDGAVEVVNTLRTVRVPWPAIDAVDGRYGLRLATAYGRVTAWAASAPSGRGRASGSSSSAATAVEQRLGELRGAGFLDDRRLERPALQTQWHRRVIATFGVLAALSLVTPLLR